MPIKGLKAHLARLRKLPAEAEKAVTQALFAGAETIANVAAISITTGGGMGKNHIVSLPGQTPNSDLGTLDGSIGAKKAGKLKARVLATADHAVPLEFGTSKMAARPFMRPARDKKADEVRDLVARGMNEALRRSRAAGQ